METITEFDSEYFRIKKQESRERAAEAKAKGILKPNAENIRKAFADAALMLVAKDLPGSEQIKKYLENVFHTQPGVPMTVVAKAKKAKLKPLLTGYMKKQDA